MNGAVHKLQIAGAPDSIAPAIRPRTGLFPSGKGRGVSQKQAVTSRRAFYACCRPRRHNVALQVSAAFPLPNSLPIRMLSQTVGFVGAGQMARALAQGFVRAGLLAEGQVVAADPVNAAIDGFRRLLPGAQIVADNAAVAKKSDVIFLAVKPQKAAEALKELHGKVAREKLVISIITGIRLQALASALGECHIARVMPNTPCLIGESASAFCLGPNCTPADGELIKQLLGSVGLATEIDEKLIDAVTGLSGSGPAFVYVMIEALADGGVRQGLPRDLALRLAAQTVKGAAQMVLTTGDHPGVLKDRVASPGGTTIAGLHVLESAGVRGTLISTVEAAAKRAAELAIEQKQ
jgi:pyrroline-5-carboxylate reductase